MWRWWRRRGGGDNRVARSDDYGHVCAYELDINRCLHQHDGDTNDSHPVDLDTGFSADHNHDRGPRRVLPRPLGMRS